MYKNILIINPFGIGDVLFTTPVIHTLKEAAHDVKIGYLCNKRTAPILRNNPYLDYLFVYDRDEFESIKKKSFFSWLKRVNSFISEIRKKRFDIAFDFSLNTQYSFFSWGAGIKQRIGFDFKRRGWMLTKKIKLTGYSNSHIVDYYALLLDYLKIGLKYRNLELHLNQDDLDYAEKILFEEKIREKDLLIGLIPGAGMSWGKDASFKHWPSENFAKLADKIIENYQAKIIIMGDFSEKAIAKRLKEKMRQEPIDLTAKTTVGQLAALLSKLKLLVTNDGGPLHMAVALGIKTVSVFGPVDESVYGPYPPSDMHSVIKKDISCRPCYRNFRLPACSEKRKCLNTVSVEDVFVAVGNQLNFS